uniref:Dynactin subunit 2 n=1 Tax=Ditylenchus dipsaci TaxID=166011 RepID=A0A915EP50_9BILA
MSVQKEDVYETDDIPVPEEIEIEEQFEDQAVEKIHVDVEGAIKLFGNRLLNADAVDFSDALNNHRRRKGYRSGHYVLEMLGVENDDKETTEQKFRRLRQEVEELMETVTREKESEQWSASITKADLDDLNDMLKAAVLKKESGDEQATAAPKTDKPPGTEVAGKSAAKSQDETASSEGEDSLSTSSSQ